MRFLLLGFIILGGFSGLGPGSTTPLAAQEGPRWTFSASAGAELWFHGMALMDPQGRGPSPLYALDYPGWVRETKVDSGIDATPLDGSASRLRRAFRQDRAFEVFHFLPLYFAGAGRVEMFGALKLLAVQSSGIPQSPTPQAALGLAAVGSVLRTPSQRTLLGEFIVALESEWDVFYRDHLRTRAAESEALARAVQERWDERFRPGLGAILNKVKLSGGSVILTPSLGLEGRVYLGTPQSWRDNVVSVRGPDDLESVEHSIYLLLRELAFPLSREAGVRAGVTGGFEDEAVVATAAIRAGALLLEDSLPQEAEGFMRFYLEQGGFRVPDGGIAGAFQEAYSLDPVYLDALREAIEVN